MSRTFISLVFCFGLMNSLFAQQTDFETVIIPVETKARDFSEYLVQLAWLNNPESAIVQDEVKNAQDLAKNTRKEWMRDVQGTFNLNEGNVRKAPQTTVADSNGNVTSIVTSNAFYPRYNVSVNVNMYSVLSQKTKNRVGNREIQIAEHRVNQRKLEIRAETLSRFTSYKVAKAIFNTRTLAEQESYASYILVQQLYKSDEKTLDEYTTSTTMYYQAQEARIRAEADVQLAKFQLEAMIGLKWEQVQHPLKED